MADSIQTETDIYQPLDELISILNLRALDSDHFEGSSMQLGWARIYGSQVVAQALMAATRTVPQDRFVHSLHCYFLRPGRPSVPLFFEVNRIRDGGSFNTRRVVVSQEGKAIFSLSASFKLDEEGLTHQFEMPDVPMPEDLPDVPALLAGPMSGFPEQFKSYWLRRRPFELRPIDLQHYMGRKKLEAKQDIWVRPVINDRQLLEVTHDRALTAVVMAYMSDMTLLDTSLFPHGKSMFDQDLQMASIDHSMWFHNPVSLGDWFLYEQESPASSRGCGTSRGQLFDRSGKLLISVAQEGLIRLKK